MKLGVPVIARNNMAHAAIIKHQSTGLIFTVSEVSLRTNSILTLSIGKSKGMIKVKTRTHQEMR